MPEIEQQDLFVLFSPMESLLWVCREEEADGKYHASEIRLTNKAMALVNKINPPQDDFNSKELIPVWRRVAVEIIQNNIKEIGPDLLKRCLDEWSV